MKFYRVTLRLSVRGIDRCADGEAVFKLPCPPSVGLYLSDIYTRGMLYVDQPIMSPVTHEWSAWCSQVVEDDMPCEEILKCFVGDWDWMDMPLPSPDDDGEPGDDDDRRDDPDGEPSDPKSEREPATDEQYQEAIRRLTMGRHKHLEE
jgi:hypothetical protein